MEHSCTEIGTEITDENGKRDCRNQPDINGWGNVIGFDVTCLHYQLTSPSSCSRVAGPIPETASKSASWLNEPCCSRCAIILPAVTGPIPGNVSSSADCAVLM